MPSAAGAVRTDAPSAQTAMPLFSTYILYHNAAAETDFTTRRRAADSCRACSGTVRSFVPRMLKNRAIIRAAHAREPCDHSYRARQEPCDHSYRTCCRNDGRPFHRGACRARPVRAPYSAVRAVFVLSVLTAAAPSLPGESTARPFSLQKYISAHFPRRLRYTIIVGANPGAWGSGAGKFPGPGRFPEPGSSGAGEFPNPEDFRSLGISEVQRFPGPETLPR